MSVCASLPSVVVSWAVCTRWKLTFSCEQRPRKAAICVTWQLVGLLTSREIRWQPTATKIRSRIRKMRPLTTDLQVHTVDTATHTTAPVETRLPIWTYSRVVIGCAVGRLIASTSVAKQSVISSPWCCVNCFVPDSFWFTATLAGKCIKCLIYFQSARLPVAQCLLAFLNIKPFKSLIVIASQLGAEA